MDRFVDDVLEFSFDGQFRRMSRVFLCLHAWQYIHVDVDRGTVVQLRNFRSGVLLPYPVPLAFSINKDGYRTLTLEVLESETKLRTVFTLVHRLVYAVVHGPIPDNIQIHHTDEDKSHNGIGNLSPKSPSEHGHITQKQQTGKKGRPRTIDDDRIAEIRVLRKSGLSIPGLVEATGYSRSTIKRILKDSKSLDKPDVPKPPDRSGEFLGF